MIKAIKRIIIIMLFTLPMFISVVQIQSAAGMWTNPEQITINGSVGEDADIALTIDSNGVIHYAHTLAFTGFEVDNSIYYGNNSDSSSAYDGFPLSELEKVELNNFPGSGYELINVANPSISVSPDGVPIVGYDGQINNSANREAFACVIDPSTGQPDLLQLSTHENSYQDQDDEANIYSTFNEIENIGSTIFASNWGVDEFLVRLDGKNPLNPSNITEINLIDNITQVQYANPYYYVAAGSTLLVINSSLTTEFGDIVATIGFSSPIQSFYLNDSSKDLFIPMEGELFWYDVEETQPLLMDSITLSTEEDVLSIANYENEYLYLACGSDGIITVNYDSYLMTFAEIDFRSTASAVNSLAIDTNKNQLLIAADNGIYNTSLNYASDIKIPQLKFSTGSDPNIDIEYQSNLNRIAVANLNGSVIFFNENSGLHNQTTLTNPAYDILISDSYIYAADGSAGIAIININDGSVSYWTDGPVDTRCLGGLESLYLVSGDAEKGLISLEKSGASLITDDFRSVSMGMGPMYIDDQDLIYINDQDLGLVIINASSISELNVVAIIELNGVFSGGLFVENGYAYITGGSSTNGLVVIDVNDFTDIPAPSYDNFGSIELSDVAVFTKEEQTWGYATDNTNNRLTYFNLTANPMIGNDKQTLGTFTDPQAITLGFEALFIADMSGDVRIVDISTPSSPSVSNLAVTNDALDVDYENGILYVARSGVSGLSYFDVSNLLSIGSEHTVSSLSAIQAIASFGSIALGATSADGIGFFDCSAHGLLGSTTLDAYVSVSHYSNNTAITSWQNENGLFYRYVYPDYSLSRIYQFSASVTDRYPQVKVQYGSDGSCYTHLIYTSLSGTHSIQYRRSVNVSSFSAAVQIDGAPGTNCDNPKMDTNGNTIGIVWEQASNADLSVALSSNYGASASWNVQTVIASLGISEINPDIYVKNNSKAEIIYQKSMSQNYTLCMRENFDDSFADEDYLVDYTIGVNSQERPVIAERNGTVIVMYQDYKYVGNFWYQADINVFGYQTFRFDLIGDYPCLTINDDPAGQYLFEGMRIAYNTTSVSNMNLTFKIVDTISGNEWINSTLIGSNGNESADYLFWSPSNYFITNNDYDLYIYNGTDLSDYLLKVRLESFDYSGSTIYNLTLPNSENIESYYNLMINPIFEYGNQLILDDNNLENEENPIFRSFGNDNHADLFYFELEQGREYNFYLQDFNTPGYVQINLFDSAIQLTNISESLLTMNSISSSASRILCNQTKTYVALIEPAEYYYNTEIDYKFYFSAIPLAPTLRAPSNNQYIGLSNLSLGIQSITLNWTQSATDKDIKSYNIEIYNSLDLIPENLVEAKNLVGISAKSYKFNTSIESKYYWRVRAIDDSIPQNNGTWSNLFLFNYDETAPQAPQLHGLNVSHNLDYLTISWDAANDGIYSAKEYNVYIATRPIFPDGGNTENYSQYLVTPNGISQTFYTIEDLKNYHYYFAVEAIDNVGFVSGFSSMINTSIAIGGFISAVGYDLPVQVGDTLIYEVTYVKSSRTTANLEPLMTFNYNDFTQGTLFHFWVQQVDQNEVYPIISTFYAQNPTSTSNDWYLVDSFTPIATFALANDVNYQDAVFKLFVENEFGDQEVSSNYYDTIWRKGTDAINARVFTYYTELSNSGEQTSASFIVDKSTGILLEMTVYDNTSDYGYSLQLTKNGSSVKMNESNWQYAYLYYIFGGVALAVLISVIIKKVEF